MSDQPTDEPTTDRPVEDPQTPARRWLKPVGYVLLAVLVVFVALDNLGKPAPASHYYEVALQLARTRASSFDKVQVHCRLQVLTP